MSVLTSPLMDGRHHGAGGADAGDGKWGGLPDPDDRLWRHPSELSSLLPAVVRRRPGRAAFGVVAGACVGAGLAAAAMVLVGTNADTSEPALATAGQPRGSQGAVTVPASLDSVPPSGFGASNAGVGAALYGPLPRFAASIVGVDVTSPAGVVNGCGFALAGGNTVVTTAGLVGSASAVYVSPAGKSRSMAVVLGVDQVAGVAVLLVSDASFPALTATEATVNVADVVMSYAPRSSPAVAVGEVTGLGVDGADSVGLPVLDAMSTDLPLESVGLGAPVFDSKGQAVGMVASAGPGLPTLVVPMARTRTVAEELAATGTVSHGWLGVSHMVATSAGLAVLDVAPGSPAAAAGIAPGSVIVAVDGYDIHTVSDLWNQVTLRRPGETIDVAVQSGSGTVHMRVVLGHAAPQPSGAPGSQS